MPYKIAILQENITQNIESTRTDQSGCRLMSLIMKYMHWMAIIGIAEISPNTTLNHVVEYNHVELLVVWFTIFTQRLKGKFLQTTTQDVNGQCEYNVIYGE